MSSPSRAIPGKCRHFVEKVWTLYRRKSGRNRAASGTVPPMREEGKGQGHHSLSFPYWWYSYHPFEKLRVEKCLLQVCLQQRNSPLKGKGFLPVLYQRQSSHRPERQPVEYLYDQLALFTGRRVTLLVASGCICTFLGSVHRK